MKTVLISLAMLLWAFSSLATQEITLGEVREHDRNHNGSRILGARATQPGPPGTGVANLYPGVPA